MAACAQRGVQPGQQGARMKIAEPMHTVGWEAAQAAVLASVRHAQSLGIAVNAAVVDRSGLTVAFLRMPGAPLHSIEIAIDKAYTSASFGLPTDRWDEVLKQHSTALARGLPLRPRFVMFGGGLPIVVQGERAGGIGVSGGSEEQDADCARAGLIALGIVA
jgi:uncharacterized protein GlcG (DUF336 family)